MSNLMPRDIRDEVEGILQNTQDDPNRGHSYLTAYQVLIQMSEATRTRLINERGTPGQGAGTYYSAASVVSDAAELIPGIEIAFIDTAFLNISLQDEADIIPGNSNVGIYRVS
jgi:hypothetical protein